MKEVTPTGISLSGVVKEYRAGREALRALDGVSLDLDDGQSVAVVGPSGCGKSTLLHIIGCLERPTAGAYRLDGADVMALGDEALSRLRRETCGFVFQRFHLVQELTVFENVELPLVYQRVRPAERRRRAVDALAAVGMADRARERPGNLSGGEQQRVAIARAVVGRPRLILADEPTGNLDADSSARVMDLLLSFHAGAAGGILIVVTHNPDVAARLQKQIALRAGRMAAPPGAGDAACPAMS